MCLLVVGKGFGCLLESKVCVMLIVMRMGRRSGWNAALVSHCVSLCRLDDIVVMSGEVGC